MELGLNIKQEQVAQLRSKVVSFKEDPSEIHRLSVLEEKHNDELQAHIALLRELCPSAKNIINLGMADCDIIDNADLILIRESLVLIRQRIVAVINSLYHEAKETEDVTCVAHTQPPQLITVAKRICLWLNDLLGDLRLVEDQIDKLSLRGFKGNSGTQFDCLKIFGNRQKVLALERKVNEKLGFKRCYAMVGQTYPRKIDSFVMFVLSCIGQSAYKFISDIKVLQSQHEIRIGLHDDIRSGERLLSLSRYLVNECRNADLTMMTQRLESGFDDCTIRKITLPNAFLAADGVLNAWLLICESLNWKKEVIKKNTWKEFLFLVTESLAETVAKEGYDYDYVKSELERECRNARDSMNVNGTNDILRILKNHEIIGRYVNYDSIFTPSSYVGCAVEQVKSFLREVIEPVRNKYMD